MAEPKKDSYTECKKCSEAAGEPVVFHFTQLEEVESMWGGGSHWECPHGHEVEP